MYDYFYGIQAEQFSFYRIPKLLFTHPVFKGMSTEAKNLYGILLDRMNLSAKNNWIDEEGRVYIIFTVDEIMEALGCAEQKAIKLLSEMDTKAGLIERKRQGLGKPNLIYVKNFISGLPESQFNYMTAKNNTQVRFLKIPGILIDTGYQLTSVLPLHKTILKPTSSPLSWALRSVPALSRAWSMPHCWELPVSEHHGLFLIGYQCILTIQKNSYIV